jgi:hypothetical protein
MTEDLPFKFPVKESLVMLSRKRTEPFREASKERSFEAAS